MKKSVIVYGNCQCVVVRDVLLKFLPGDEYEVVYIMDSGNPTRGEVSLPSEQLNRCVALLEQWTDWGDFFPLRGQLPSSCRRLSLPSLQFLTFWPFDATDPRNKPEPPEFPYGRYPYGDRLALSLLKKAGEPDEALKRYRDADIGQQADLDRLHEMVLERVARMDSHVGSSLTSYIENNFRSQRLFWTPGHPTAILLARIALLATQALGLSSTAEQIEEHLADNRTAIHVPVHPQVIEHFGLTCVTPETEYQYLDGRKFTFDEWMFHYLHGF